MMTLIIVNIDCDQTSLSVEILSRTGFFFSSGDVVIIAGRLVNPNLSDRVIIDAYKLDSSKSFSPEEFNWPYEVIDISQRVYHH